MERLYDRSSYEKEFTAVVTGCRETKERFAVTLDRTAFFPEGGGQPFDTGTLGNVTVLDVQEIGGEVIPLYRRSSGSWKQGPGSAGLGTEIFPYAGPFRRTHYYRLYT